jgi:hypothetical protein
MSDDTVPQEPRYRRLSDKILIASHHACDQGDVVVAKFLLEVSEGIIKRPANLPAGVERRSRETLVAAHERLWQIEHPEPPEI